MSRLSVYRRCELVDMAHGAWFGSPCCAATLPFESAISYPPRRIFVGRTFLPIRLDSGSACLPCGICFITGTGLEKLVPLSCHMF